MDRFGDTGSLVRASSTSNRPATPLALSSAPLWMYPTGPKLLLAETKEGRPVQDQEHIPGTWRLVSGEHNGKPLPDDRVSLAFGIQLGVPDRTLRDEEVEERMSRAQERLRAHLGAEIRTG